MFKSELDIKVCQYSHYNFCSKCCAKFVDITNKVKNNLCNKQCSLINDEDTKDQSWRNCATPTFPTQSVYQYCDDMEKSEYREDTCKVDMCNLCCSKYDYDSKIKISSNSLKLCYANCERSKFIIIIF